MNRLRNAYWALWDRHPAAVYLTMLAILLGSALGLLAAILLSTVLALVPMGALIADALLLHFALTGDA